MSGRDEKSCSEPSWVWPVPPAASRPIPHLGAPDKGYMCLTRGLTQKTAQRIQKHCKDKHQWVNPQTRGKVIQKHDERPDLCPTPGISSTRAGSRAARKGVGRSRSHPSMRIRLQRCGDEQPKITSRTDFSGLHAFREPIPSLSPHEVLVKVRSLALNYRDVVIARSQYPFEVKDQVVPISDMAGEIVQVGSDLVASGGLAVGDRVVAPLSPSTLYGPLSTTADTFGGFVDGMCREYVALPAHIVVKLPRTGHSFAQWASLVCTGSTVWNAFYGNAPLKPGDTVLVLGTGGISLTALVFAKAAGATTIVTSSSDEKLEYVKSKYGADHTINYNKTPNWAAEVQRITNGKGVNHIIEVTGAGTIEQSIESVAHGGIISIIGFMAPLPQEKMPDVCGEPWATDASGQVVWI
ncbi:uncharacterized protein GGS25DRAFT_525195 [Hypoxylon fragiforme]|uniref:uncharacterized protein n=1 Tax=Hypoxylon fragiforme TaxID=63214 RepID=UPI0020C60A4B|nr:uncharacterized protein GGS25DRAFT_525195 [Hypoxylon fragiforme]KAI2603919.1 hypothetical protein GGS25DRAFT_525195 [Hypoxylon fragiforme]